MVATIVVVIFAACDERPTAPSPQPSGVSPAPVTIVALTISGPATIAPGETVQFTATARHSDGSTRNVANEVTWATGSQSVLVVSSTGAATAVRPGETSIQCSLGSRTANISEVIVVPASTYRLIGRVTESGTGLNVSDGRVEVTAGAGRGLVAPVNGGTFHLFGVAGDVEVRVVADGYQEERKRLQVASHQVVDVSLSLVRPRPDVSGTYTLRVTAAPECRSILPADAISRTYTAVLRQEGVHVSALLDGAAFAVQHNRTYNRFGGFVEPTRVRFYIEGPLDFYYASYGPDVVEQLSETTFFTMSGSVISSVSSGAVVAGLLSGLIEAVRGDPGRFDRIASCQSSQHEFVLRR
jgi:hypothetical protein